MDEDMVERVAREIAHADGEDYMEDYKRFDRLARAAIEAIRDADVGAMRVLLHSGTWSTAEELWNAVLDDALAPTPPE